MMPARHFEANSRLSWQVNYEGVFRYASSRWFLQALEVLVESGVHGVAVDVWVRIKSACVTTMHALPPCASHSNAQRPGASISFADADKQAMVLLGATTESTTWHLDA